ncbi:hypothetical protein VE03_00032 [Pseudogymnoascus sp. 23342-1-I1]|nr:hypothetical protein VE03_00032 [Pseudogymnoascus sp. 23342-1-I1]
MAKEAQTKLLELEKEDAPIAEQLEQAGQFAGIEWLDFLQTAIATAPGEEVRTGGNFHGREEWVLRWLLKKLGGEEARRCPQAWRLLRCLVQRVPVPMAARCLNERRGVGMLRLGAEEAVGRRGRKGEVGKGGDKAGSKKRKRGEEAVTGGSVEEETYDVAEAMFEVLEQIVGLAAPEEQREGDAFAAEYMKSVTRLAPEESAKLLGSWLELCRLTRDRGDEAQLSGWLTPFIETWKARMDGGDDSLLFSTHCLVPLLDLSSSPELLPQWQTQLEQLLSRNIILPARNAYTASKTTDVLASFVSSAVAARPDFAPILFENAIHSLQPNSTHRSRTQDAAWLQALFRVLSDACPADQREVKNGAINKMMKMCLEHKIPLDVDLLRSITLECGLHSEGTDEEIIATVIALDGLVFTIPDAEEKDLLKELFSRITLLSTTPEWPEMADTYVDRILVPLMGHFAKARDLTGFINHWYEQLVEFDSIISDRKSELGHFGAWEDGALLAKLKETMEASLTSEQIKSILDGIREKTGSPGPALVMMDAVAGALTREETVGVAELPLWAFSWVMAHEDVPERYKHRQPQILTHVMDATSLTAFQQQWGSDIDMARHVTNAGVMVTTSKSLVELFRSAASQHTLLSLVNKESVNEKLVLAMKDVTQSFFVEDAIPWFASSGKGSKKKDSMGRSIGIKLQTPDTALALAKIILVDYPKLIKVVAAPGSSGQSVLQTLFWLASMTTPFSAENSPNRWIRRNKDAFPGLWRTMLKNDDVLNDQELIKTIIDIILKSGTHETNPIENRMSCNGFAIECLNSLPIEVFSRSTRERVLKAWPPAAPEPSLNDTKTLAYRMSNIDAAVISLKMKMMERPTIYEGFTFKDLDSLAQAISELSPDPRAPLEAFAEYARRALGHIEDTLGQAKSDTFVKDMVAEIRLRDPDDSSKSTIGCGRIQLALVFLHFFCTNETRMLKIDGVTAEKISSIWTTFRVELIANLRRLLQRPTKLKSATDERSMSLSSTISALDHPLFKLDSLSSLYDDAISCVKDLEARNPVLASQINTFFIAHIPETSKVEQSSDLFDEDVTTSAGRIAIMKAMQAKTATMDESEKRDLLVRVLLPASTQNLDKLLAIHYVLESCEDQSPDSTSTSLTTVYITLTKTLISPPSLPHLSLLTSILSHTLRTKPRCVSQHAIESTLAAIPAHLARPRFSPARTHTLLTSLLATLLTTHRLSVTSRAPLLNLALLALLTPLFTAEVGVKHAEAYTRLLTTLADPAAAAVRASSATPLVSATAKAKRQAGAHLPVVVGAYVKMSLDPGSRMQLAVREELKRGLWVVFGAMGQEGRKVLGEEMDRSGRDVLRGLVGEWVRFGKWKGN